MEKITIDDEKYPEKLKKIASPPKQLYILGDNSILNQKSIAIIGSRVCTEKGGAIAEKFSSKLSKLGVNIISGMAIGIDSKAHTGCLQGKGKTIAVLGSGFNHIFPPQNKKLLKQILENGGAIITEYEENVEVFSGGFIQRNRIVSGLSDGVLIIEAKYRSGTSITAGFAIEQGKKVFCLPHSIDEIEGIGTNKLIQLGAKLVTNIYDITNELNITVKKEKEIEIHQNPPKEYEEIFNLISKEPINIDEICKKTKKSIREINSVITMLELEGYIESLPGKRYKEKTCI